MYAAVGLQYFMHACFFTDFYIQTSWLNENFYLFFVLFMFSWAFL